MSEFAPIPIEQRNLSEVDHLNNYRDAEGAITPWAKQEVYKNLVSAIKEGGIPNAIHVSEHPYMPTGEIDAAGKPIMAYTWLARTAIQHAMSGRRYHQHPAALKRVEVEIEEAKHDQVTLRPGVKKVFISPRMSATDASSEVANREHLGKDDAVRVSEAIADSEGTIVARRMEALLVRDVPLAAWVALLKDPNNIFGKSIVVDNETSALSVMKVHRELEVPAEALPEGIVSLVEAALQYIDDPVDRLSIEKQLERFREDQVELDETAQFYAEDWLEFEVALAESLHKKQTTYTINRFIAGMQDEFNDNDLAFIEARHLGNQTYAMDRELAALLEKAKQYTLFSTAGIDSNNERLINQISDMHYQKIRTNIRLARIAAASGDHEGARALRAETDRQVARQNLTGVGGGCPGELEAMFASKDTNPLDDTSNKFDTRDENLTSTYEKKVGRTKKAKCRIENCPTRPRAVTVGGCNVCIERCQKMFDRGEDPTKERYALEPKQQRQYGRTATRELAVH